MVVIDQEAVVVWLLKMVASGHRTDVVRLLEMVVFGQETDVVWLLEIVVTEIRLSCFGCQEWV